MLTQRLCPREAAAAGIVAIGTGGARWPERPTDRMRHLPSVPSRANNHRSSQEGCLVQVTATQAKNRFGAVCAQTKVGPVLAQWDGRIDTVIVSIQPSEALKGASQSNTLAQRPRSFETATEARSMSRTACGATRCVSGHTRLLTLVPRGPLDRCRPPADACQKPEQDPLFLVPAQPVVHSDLLRGQHIHHGQVIAKVCLA
jgi:hypothetical protein